MSNESIGTEHPLFSERAFNFIRQFAVTLVLHRKAYGFIREYQPWKGLRRYGWTVKVLVLVAVLLGLRIFQSFYEIISEAVGNPQVFSAGLVSGFSSLSLEKFSWMLQGGQKYLVLIVLEVITFHFIQRTLEIRMGRQPDHSFKAFMRVEKRMIIVSLIAWITESIVQGLVNIPLDIFGFDFLKQPFGLVIQFFFLGFTFIDNYHECFGLNITQSRKRSWEVAGVAVAAGLVAYVLMFVPLVGVVAATMLGAVTAGMAMDRFAPVTEEEVAAFEMERAVKKRRKQKDDR
jgi:hypothetical protein